MTYHCTSLEEVLAEATPAWMAQPSGVGRRFDPTTARDLDALTEGLGLHSTLSMDPTTPERIRHTEHPHLR